MFSLTAYLLKRASRKNVKTVNNNHMSTEEQLKCVNEAIALTNKRKANSNDIYHFILNQLTYIKSCISDKKINRNRLKQVNIGTIAVRELYDDLEYSELLKHVYFIVYYIQEGKIVPKLDDSGNISR